MGSLRFELRSQHPERHRMARLPHDPSLVWVQVLHYYLVCQQHPPAAITLQAEIVEDPFWILACISPLRELLPGCRDDFTACKTSYGYHNNGPASLISLLLTGRTSGTVRVRLGRAASWFPSAVSRLRAESGRTRGTHPLSVGRCATPRCRARVPSGSPRPGP